MKIIKLTVTDEDGTDHVWEGIEGHVNVTTMSKIGQPYQQRVSASMLLEPRPDVKGA